MARIAFRRPKAVLLALVLLLVAGAFYVIQPTPADAQEQTGATATKECPNAPVTDPYTIGDTVVCTATFQNDGAFPATVTLLTETEPFVAVGSPANGTPTAINCTLADGTTVIDAGDTLAPGAVCTRVFEITIPDDPALCNTAYRDRVDIELAYPNFAPPLTAGAFATHTLLVVCQPTITVTKLADDLSKVGDPVTYTIEVCNTGLVTVNRQSVIDSLIGDITAEFAATLAPGACDEVVLSRDVVEGDPDPLENTVTATYSAGIQTATAEASATTELFQPGVGVTKSCVPDPIVVGEAELCTIVVTNTSSADAPDLVNGTIEDTLTGNLLDPTNTAVVSTTCAATLPTGGSCTITTTREVLEDDPSPLENTVTVAYNPSGFPNVITASASDSVNVEAPAITVTKVADELSKVGDPVTYTITVCNTGVVPVDRESVIDSLIGDITAEFLATLAPGACDEVVVTSVVLEDDPDPLVNTVTATYSAGAVEATAEASDSTNLFQPSVGVTKSCAPDPIVVGEDELCTIVVTNDSSADAPDLVNGTIIDTLTGDLLDATNTAVVSTTCAATLPTGGSCTIETTRTVLEDDPTPLVNTVTVAYNPSGFPNVITDTASDSVNIVAPAITVTKVADELSKVGDPVTYTITVCNTGVVPVDRESVIDSLIGDITAEFLATLAPGACDEVVLARDVAEGDLDPLVNTVTATYSAGTVEATAEASDSTNLFQPSVGVTKTCSPDPTVVGEDELCTIVVTNTSSADAPDLVNGTILDTLTGDLLDATNTAVVSTTCAATLPTGGSCTIETTRTVLESDPSPLVNTVTVAYNPSGFPNVITASATDSVNVEAPAITVTMLADEASKLSDPVTYTIEVCNTGLVTVNRQTVIASLLGDITGEFLATLAPAACDEVVVSRDVAAGDPDSLVNTVTATYSALAVEATAEASVTTNLFQPGVGVTMTCEPDPIEVGEDEVCTIVVTNTSSDDAPDLVNGTITDTLTGNLLDLTNAAVVDSTCVAELPTGESCTITTTRVVLESDPSPLENTVTVHYNPFDFPNDITGSATDSVIIEGAPPPPPSVPPATPPPPPGQPLPRTGAGLDRTAVAGMAALFAGGIALAASKKLRRRHA